MSEEEIIAKYVMEKYPEILNTIDYASYRASIKFKEMMDGFKEGLDKFLKAAKPIMDRINKETEGVADDEGS